MNWVQANSVCGSVIYSITVDGLPYTNFPFIAAFYSSGQIDFSSNSFSDAGVYTISVTGSGNLSLSSTKSFTLTVTNPCIGLSIIPTYTSLNLYYELLGVPQNNSLGFFSYDTTYTICGIFYYNLSLSGGSIPSYYTFASSSNSFIINSSDTTLCGTT